MSGGDRAEQLAAMQWCEKACIDIHHADPLTGYPANEVIAWVRELGGEARYENDPPADVLHDDLVGPQRVREAYIRRGTYARIVVRTADSWAHARPGDWIVPTDQWVTVNGYQFTSSLSWPGATRLFRMVDPVTYQQEQDQPR